MLLLSILLTLLPAPVWGQCGDITVIAQAAKQVLEGMQNKYNVTTSSPLGTEFDLRFAPANYTHAGVNPSSRYMLPRVGPWGEGDLGGDSFLNWGVGQVVPLTSREALVVTLCTPPPVRFWSWEAAVLYRLNLSDVLAPGAPISNTVNSASLLAATPGTPLVVVMTADRATEQAVRAAFASVRPALNVAVVGINGTSALLQFGGRPLEQACDMFQLCMRVHASPTQAATQEWKAYLASRFPVMLVKPAFAAPDAPLCPIADRPVRQGPTNEARLAARREVLRAVIVRAMQQAGLGLRLEVPFSPVQLDKRRCLVDPNYHPYTPTGGCYGTSSDGRYTLSNAYKLPQGNMSSLVLFVIGANHQATGNAADNQLFFDKNVVRNPEDLAGSAEFFLKNASQPEDAGMFAFAFAEACDRNLTSSFCARVPAAAGGQEGVLLRFEAYLDADSATRPSPGLVHPLALLFTA